MINAKDVLEARLLLAALFHAARLTAGRPNSREEAIRFALQDADELLTQAQAFKGRP